MVPFRSTGGSGERERPSHHQTVRLGAGRHGGPGGSVCVMELASMLAGERFSDHPRSVCPTLSALLRAYNDALGEEDRQKLYHYASEAVGTRDSYELQESRARFALAWTRSRQYGRRRWWAARIRREQLPNDASPQDIAEFVVRSLGRRPTPESHQAMQGLLDWLISMHPADGEVPVLAPVAPPASTHQFSV
jgi:hypothetical protein